MLPPDSSTDISQRLSSIGLELVRQNKFHEAKVLAGRVGSKFLAMGGFSPAYVDSEAFFTDNDEAFEAYFEASEAPLIFGDSHTRMTFAEIGQHLGAAPSPLVIFKPGASIVGFGRRTSSLETFNKLLRYVTKFSPNVIIFKLGQVDVEVGLYYRMIMKGETVDFREFFTSSIKRYLKAVQALPTTSTYHLCGINLPSIFSHDKAIDYVTKCLANEAAGVELRPVREKVERLLPPIGMRTKISLFFNELLQEAALAHGLGYFDLTEVLMDQESGLLKARYSQENDHHILTSPGDRAFFYEQLSTTLGL